MKNGAAATIAIALVTPVDAQDRPSIAPKSMQAIAPGLADYTDRVLFGDVWERGELSPRDRSMVTLSVLISTGKSAQLTSHLVRGLTNGVKPIEVSGMVTHLAFYSGWPNAVSAITVIEQVFAERKIDLAGLRGTDPKDAQLPASDPTREAMVTRETGSVSPKFAELTNGVLFADLWRRTDISPRDRSLVTIAALAANGDTEALRFHIGRGIENGLSRPQIAEALTHLAFYAGWPKATAAIAVLAEFDQAKATDDGSPALSVFNPGSRPTAGPSSNFTGQVSVTSRFEATGEARLAGATVTFAKGARSNWHSHPLGQLLVITQGRGWVQAEGEAVREVRPGDVVWTGPGVKHWHGATRTSGMAHVAVAEAIEGEIVTWLEPVTDAQFRFPG